MIINDLFFYENGFLFWKPKKLRGFTLSNKKAGTLNKGYLWIKSKFLEKQISVHKAVWIYHHGDIPDGMLVDHIDRNPLNNMVENLRLVTSSQNCLNTNGKSNKKSGLPCNIYIDWEYNGITKYRVQICKEGKIYRVGNLDIDEAKRIRDDIKNDICGKYSPFIKEADL